MFGKSKQPKSLPPEEYAIHLREQASSGTRKRPSPYIGESLDQGSAEQKRAYEKSKFFQVYLNQTRGIGLCFDELESTTCKIGTEDQPDLGRRYNVSYNSLDIGTVEIVLGYDLLRDDDGKGEILALYFDLKRLEFLDYGDAVGLLQQLALAMMPLGNTNDDHQTARNMASDYMLQALWNNKNEEALGLWTNAEKASLRATGSFTGPAGYYSYAIEHWGKTIDLMAEPNRDGLPTGDKDI